MGGNKLVIVTGYVAAIKLKKHVDKSFVSVSIPVSERVKEGEAWIDGPTDWHWFDIWGFDAKRAERLEKGDLIQISATETLRESRESEPKRSYRVKSFEVIKRGERKQREPYATTREDDNDLPF